jgi:hypothetical protein
MIDIRVGKGIRRVTLLKQDEAGVMTATTVYRAKKRKKKKGSPGVREVERVVRALGEAQKSVADTFVRRHKRSNRKRKDGWLHDLGQNVFKAGGKGLRKLMKRSGF